MEAKRTEPWMNCHLKTLQRCARVSAAKAQKAVGKKDPKGTHGDGSGAQAARALLVLLRLGLEDRKRSA